jgi:hypothetical protein
MKISLAAARLKLQQIPLSVVKAKGYVTIIYFNP